MLTLAFPPFDIGPLVWVALVPLLLSLSRSTSKQAWSGGYLFGWLFSLGQLFWLAQLTQRWTGSPWLALVPWLLASAGMSCYFGLFGLFCHRCFQREMVWAVPFVWAGIEVFRTYIPMLAFPWALLSTPLWRFPLLIQPASVGSCYLISFWVVAVNLSVLGLFRPLAATHRKWLGGISIALPAASIALFLAPHSPSPVRVSLAQLGLDLAFGKPADIQAQVPARVQQDVLAAKRDGSTLVVFSEGIASGSEASNFFDFPLPVTPATLFGAQRRVGRHTVYQSAIGFDGHWHHADKTRLVIFGEFVPGRDFLPFLQAFGLPGGDLSAGVTGVQAMDLNGVRVGPLLCFEGLFPDLSYRQALNNSQLLAVMSNDDWFMNSSAPAQLREAAIWRAVETGLPVVRVGSLGYSLLVDGRGQVVGNLPLGKAQVSSFQTNLGPRNPWTPMLPLFPICCVLVTFFTIVTRKHRAAKEPEMAK